MKTDGVPVTFPARAAHAAWAFLGLSAALGLSGPARAETIPVEIVLSTGMGGPPMDRFYCDGRIYAKIIFPRGYRGERRVEGRWVNPAGRTQENVETSVAFTGRTPRPVHLWMSFDRAPLDAFALRERGTAFQGLWRFRAYADGTPLADKTFSVQCTEE